MNPSFRFLRKQIYTAERTISFEIFKRGRDAAEREANALQIGEQISSMVHDGQFIEGKNMKGKQPEIGANEMHQKVSTMNE